MNDEVMEKLESLVAGFQTVLYEEDDAFLSNMKTHALVDDDVRRYKYWEWPAGVGLYSCYRLYEKTGKRSYADILDTYYQKCMGLGLPAKNINTCAPLLALALWNLHDRKDHYFSICHDWAEWLLTSAPRTEEGGLQHITSDTRNDGELWDDTLFMAVFFLAVMGKLERNDKYVEEAQYQLLVHQKYLADTKSGLWYHGWSFLSRTNMAGAFWGRGNCWITAFIPDFLHYCPCDDVLKRYFSNILRDQVCALVSLQDKSGLWHTVLDDPTSYLEVSASCGIAYGMLAGWREGLLDDSAHEAAVRALRPVLDHIDANGVVSGVSYGTPMGRESKDFYKRIPIRSMPYGTALALLFLMEII